MRRSSQDPATELDVERAGEVLGQAPPAVTKSDEGVPVLDFPLADHGPDNGVEPGAVATAGQHSDSHHHSSIETAASPITCRVRR